MTGEGADRLDLELYGAALDRNDQAIDLPRSNARGMLDEGTREADVKEACIRLVESNGNPRPYAHAVPPPLDAIGGGWCPGAFSPWSLGWRACAIVGSIGWVHGHTLLEATKS